MMTRSRYDEDGSRVGPSSGSNMGINSIGFADGHMKALPVEFTKSMAWNPAKE